MAIACRHRGFALLVALLAWAAVGLQLVLTLGKVTAGGQGVAWGLVVFFGYFTVLTNILAAIALSAGLLAPATRFGHWWLRPGVVTAIAAAIGIVGISYFLLLRKTWDPQGWQLGADVLLHYVVPVLFVAHWWLAVPKHDLTWRQIPAWTAYPLVYLVYMLLRGEMTGLYPYPFADVAALGYPTTLRNAGAILVSFIAVAVVMIGLGRWRDRRSAVQDLV